MLLKRTEPVTKLSLPLNLYLHFSVVILGEKKVYLERTEQCILIAVLKYCLKVLNLVTDYIFCIVTGSKILGREPHLEKNFIFLENNFLG